MGHFELFENSSNPNKWDSRKIVRFQIDFVRGKRLVGWFTVLPSQVNIIRGRYKHGGAQGSYQASAAWYICVTARGGPGRTGKKAHTNTQCNIAAIYCRRAPGNAAMVGCSKVLEIEFCTIDWFGCTVGVGGKRFRVGYNTQGPMPEARSAQS